MDRYRITACPADSGLNVLPRRLTMTTAGYGEVDEFDDVALISI
jgi:hypothetical protein